MLADLRYAARRLKANPGFTVVSVITLALGIGASTAIFSAVNPILFEPLPYPQAGRVIMVSDAGPDRSRIDVTFGSFREILERSHGFEALAVMRPWQPTLTGMLPPERFDGHVTNLMLGRDAHRRGEFAMRAALGAAGPRLARQVLTESLLVALLGGAVGMLVASTEVDALVALSPPDLPRVSAIAVDRSAFAFALALTTMIGLAVGLVPALQAIDAFLSNG